MAAIWVGSALGAMVKPFEDAVVAAEVGEVTARSNRISAGT